MTRQIPNLFTLLNLVFGCIAIVFIMQNGLVVQYTPEGSQVITVGEKLWMGSLFILLAAVVDFLDGFLARLLKASSEMGMQLDSLADVVSFGVAPSMIIYQFLRLSYAGNVDGLNISVIALLPAFFIAAAGAYRLARYNLTSDVQTENFIGLPIPACGLFVATLPVLYWVTENELVHRILINSWTLYGLIILLCFLLVCRLPMMNMKFKNFTLNDNKTRYILLVISILSIVLLQWLAAPIILVAYIVLSLFFLKKNHDVYGRN